MYCENCGANIPDDSLFCTECGAKVEMENLGTGTANGVADNGNARASVKMKPNMQNHEETTSSCRTATARKDPEKGNRKYKKCVSKEEFAKRRKILIIAGGAAIAICAASVLFAVYYKPTINLNDYMTIKFDGYDTIGTAEPDFDMEQFEEDNSKYFDKGKSKKKKSLFSTAATAAELSSESLDSESYNFIDDCIDGSLDKDSGLSNGDEVTYTWACDDNRVLKKYGVKLKYKDISATVDGLKKADTFDPFEGMEVSFHGYDGKGNVQITAQPVNPEAQYLNYKIDKNSDLSNGDIVTVSISEGYSGSIEQECLDRFQSIPSVKEKSFTVSGLQHYLTSFSEISDEAMADMKKEAEKDFMKNIADNWDDTQTLKNLNYVGNYMLTTPETEDFSGSIINCIYLVYRYDVHDSYSNGKEAYSKDNSVFWYAQFYNILADDVGNTYFDVNRMRIPNDTITVESGISSGWSSKVWRYVGYDSIESMYKAKIKPDTYDYNCEDNIDNDTSDENNPLATDDIEDTETEDTASEGCIFPESSEKKIDTDDIKNLSDDEIQYAINEIYARHGYRFNDKNYLKYYESLDWYEGTVASSDFSENVFNDIERSNLDVLKAERDKR